jgi:hypothetical protein
MTMRRPVAWCDSSGRFATMELPHWVDSRCGRWPRSQETSASAERVSPGAATPDTDAGASARTDRASLACGSCTACAGRPSRPVAARADATRANASARPWCCLEHWHTHSYLLRARGQSHLSSRLPLLATRRQRRRATTAQALPLAIRAPRLEVVADPTWPAVHRFSGCRAGAWAFHVGSSSRDRGFVLRYRCDIANRSEARLPCSRTETESPQGSSLHTRGIVRMRSSGRSRGGRGKHSRVPMVPCRSSLTPQGGTNLRPPSKLQGVTEQR